MGCLVHCSRGTAIAGVRVYREMSYLQGFQGFLLVAEMGVYAFLVFCICILI
jgi:hypothetical protein